MIFNEYEMDETYRHTGYKVLVGENQGKYVGGRKISNSL
jgi:hypothetical protein